MQYPIFELPDGQKIPNCDARSPLGVTVIVDKSCYITFLLSLVSLDSLNENLSISMITNKHCVPYVINQFELEFGDAVRYTGVICKRRYPSLLSLFFVPSS